ncbi:50S ribosomal protein L25 [Planctomycetales bacterium]|nr:50S ribosomal protein L25 [Planctomycetales bacterium]
MAKALSLSVKLRDSVGKRRNRRLRKSGLVPAVLYGHQKEPQSLSIPVSEIEAAVRHGNRFVELKGGLSEQALIKDVQWNTWGTEILHVDFTRVSEHEKITVVVPIELRGEAPGTKEGGVIKHALHQIELECEAASVPEKIEININHLAFNALIHVSDVELPPGTKSLTDASLLVVGCVPPVEEVEVETVAGEEEPEVIGRKKPEEPEK